VIFPAHYEVVQFEEPAFREPGMVWIVDLNRGSSVTNDAERVVAELNDRFPGFRIIYRDSMGNWDELKHDNGKFTGFKPARALGAVFSGKKP